VTDPSAANDAQGAGFLAPRAGAQPRDRCLRCGKETPAGQSLCEEHNPRRLAGPSTTQMHATIFGGIVIGVLAFFVIARFAVGTTGPYTTEVTATTAGPAGGAAVSFVVTNEGDSDGVADCRVTRDGVPRPDDLAFRTERVPAGGTVAFQRDLLPPPVDSVGYDPESLSIRCT
jgi:hypothetical protein